MMMNCVKGKWGGGISALENKETDQLYGFTDQLICAFVLHIQTGFSLDAAKVKKYQCKCLKDYRPISVNIYVDFIYVFCFKW